MLVYEGVETLIFIHAFGVDSEQVDALIVSEAFPPNQGEAYEELTLSQCQCKPAYQGLHL